MLYGTWYGDGLHGRAAVATRRRRRLTGPRGSPDRRLVHQACPRRDPLQACQRDLETVGRLLLSDLTPLVSAQVGVIYQVVNEDPPVLRLLSAYADDGQHGHAPVIRMGEGLIGQCAADRRRMLVSNLPASVSPVGSALFKVPPRNVIVIPVLFENLDKIHSVVDFTEKGAIVTRTSTDAKVVAALQGHATEVNELVQGGMFAMMRGMMTRTAHRRP